MALSTKKCIYVDLSNIFGGICEIFNEGVYIDFSTLMPLLDEQFEGIDQFKVYGAYMGIDQVLKHGEQFVRSQKEFISSATIPGVYFGKGHISKDRKEKGVDMKLGIDMVNDAHYDNFGEYILFSGDADFQYPVDIIKKMQKKFHYCGFANRFHSYFAWQSNKKIVLDYNKLFANTVTAHKLPSDLNIVDLYRRKDVRTKSIII